MTPEQINIAIAKHQGWTDIELRGDCYYGFVPDSEMLDSQGAQDQRFIIPDYLNDITVITNILPFGATIKKYKNGWEVWGYDDTEEMKMIACAGKDLGPTAGEFYLRHHKKWIELNNMKDKHFNENDREGAFTEFVNETNPCRLVLSNHWASKGYWLEYPPYTKTNTMDSILDQKPMDL